MSKLELRPSVVNSTTSCDLYSGGTRVGYLGNQARRWYWELDSFDTDAYAEGWCPTKELAIETAQDCWDAMEKLAQSGGEA